MRYTARQYAAALNAVAKDAPAEKARELAANFLTLLFRHGARRRLPAILAASRILERRAQHARRVRIRAATADIAERITRTFDAGDTVTIVIDPLVRAGASVTIDGRRIDGTLQRRLRDLRAAVAAY